MLIEVMLIKKECIQNYVENIIKKHKTVTDNRPIRLYANNIENRITFKIKSGTYIKN